MVQEQLEALPTLKWQLEMREFALIVHSRIRMGGVTVKSAACRWADLAWLALARLDYEL